MTDVFKQLRDGWPIILGISVLVSALVSAWMTLYVQNIVKEAIVANNKIITPGQLQFQLDIAKALDDAGDNKEGIVRIEKKLDKLLDLMLDRARRNN